MKLTLTTTHPDKEKVKEIRNRIRENDGYCPCTLDPCTLEKIKTLYVCGESLEKMLKEDVKDGYCNCGLYFKKLDEIEASVKDD